MANQIYLKFARKGNELILKFMSRGKSNPDATIKVKNLTAPNFDCWDKEKQLFNEPTQLAIDNNKVLQTLISELERLIAEGKPQDGKELKEMYKSGIIKPKKGTLTFGQFILQEIEVMRTGGDGKKPSRNYQTYINLLHKLEAEGNIINVPISEICNAHFIQFCDFLLTLPIDKGRSNYISIAKHFKAMHNRLLERELNTNALVYPYQKHAPTIGTKKERISLTEKQYKKFVELDLCKISQSGINADFYKELYHDFCIFLYEMKMRPADVIRLHNRNIIELNGKGCIKYIIEKKKNSSKNICINPLTTKAYEIVNKYRNQSSQGYVFPFSMNEYDWDYMDAKSWNRWNNRKSRALEMIRSFLKKTAPLIGVNPNDFINYTFRHSTLTHETTSKTKDLIRIAKEAGTSVKMLQDHYYGLEAVI